MIEYLGFVAEGEGQTVNEPASEAEVTPLMEANGWRDAQEEETSER